MLEQDDDLISPSAVAPPRPLLDTFTLRSALEKALGDQALYLRLRPHSKLPRGKYSKGGRNRLSALPKTGNFGVIPQGRLIVLDFDRHSLTSASLPEQIDFFSELLQVDLYRTFAVATPSGGLHVYLFLPEGSNAHELEDFPKASLRGYSEAFGQVVGRVLELDADVRSSKVNGYVVGPSSITLDDFHEENSYWIADESIGFHEGSLDTILTLTDEALERVAQAVRWKREQLTKASPKGAEPAHVTPRPDYALDAEGAPLFREPPTAAVLADLKAKLKRKDAISYHARRAFVKAALHCCYSDYAIALTCMDLGIARDSHSQAQLTWRELLLDIGSFTPSERYHSLYCPTGRRIQRAAQAATARKEAQPEREFNLETFTAHNKRLVADRKLPQTDLPFRAANHRVLDVGKMERRLLDALPRGAKSQQYRDAVAVIDYFLQPLANVGARKIVLALAALQQELKLTSSRSSQALRILRRENILVLQDRQRTGLAATYQVEEEFTHRLLTKYLRATWAAHGEALGQVAPIYFDRYTGDFREVLTRTRVDVPDKVTDELSSMGNALEEFGPGAALPYLSRVRAAPFPARARAEAAGQAFAEAEDVSPPDGELEDEVFMLDEEPLAFSEAFEAHSPSPPREVDIPPPPC